MENRRLHRRTTRPVCEALESRELLSASHAIHDLKRSAYHTAVAMLTRPRSDAVPASILNNLTLLRTVSTIPANGDVNPYGVAFVPNGIPSGGLLNPGDILVSNFNNSTNLQGTGTTIVNIAPNGTQALFSTQGASLGLDTGLAVLKSGFVLVANVPNNPQTNVGTPTSPNPQGSILVLDKSGNLLQTFSDPIRLNGPWDLTVAVDRGSSATIFVSNVLSGTVWRVYLAIRPSSTTPIKVTGAVEIGSGFLHGASQAGFVAGPGGLAFNVTTDTLYVASQFDNSIYAIHNARHTRDQGTGKLLVSDPTNLHAPIGLVLAPNGNLIAANSDAFNVDPTQPSELVEYTQTGVFVARHSVDPANGGAFGLAISNGMLAAVNDNGPSLEILTFPT
jgi:hypothetical protein